MHGFVKILFSFLLMLFLIGCNEEDITCSDNDTNRPSAPLEKDDLSMTVRIDENDTQKYILPLKPKPGTNYKVNCGNSGDYQYDMSGEYTCHYSSVGVYDITVKGDLASMNSQLGPNANKLILLNQAKEDLASMNSEIDSNAHKLISLNQWGKSAWTSLEKAFFNCENMELLAKDAPNLTKVDNDNDNVPVSYMFYNTKEFNQNISDWNVSGVTNMTNMFNNS
ncbi:MAG: BspA family leucine-rich repeat surface protein, partial [Sulfurospirillum sp.]|nr:BspA family leucine-rich repeat surface protein [Sulfurospirillum sp.]